MEKRGVIAPGWTPPSEKGKVPQDEEALEAHLVKQAADTVVAGLAKKSGNAPARQA